MKKLENLIVFFDGACPLCMREIAFYRRRKGAEEIVWTDISQTEGVDVAPGLSACDARARFHVLDEKGALYSGGDAFAKLWARLPAFRAAGLIAQRQPFRWILNRAYDFFLKVRPQLQSLARRRLSA